MQNVVRNTVLLATFILELFAGFFVLCVALFVVAPQTLGNGSDEENLEENTQKRKSRILTTRSQRTIVLQLVLMGAVDVFSAVLCFMMVSFDLSGYDSWYLTYIQWGIATPPMIIVLCLVCSLDFDSTLVLSFIDAMVILCGAMAALFDRNDLKYTWFCMGGLFFVMLFGIFFQRRAIMTKQIHKVLQQEDSDEIVTMKEEVKRDQRLSSRLILITLTTWSLYPITWLIEESEIIDKSDADIIHSVFAVFAKVTFGFVLTYYRTRLSGGRSYGIFSIPALIVRSSPSPSSSPLQHTSLVSLGVFSSSPSSSGASSPVSPRREKEKEKEREKMKENRVDVQEIDDGPAGPFAIS